MAYEFGIGTTLIGITTLDQLTVPVTFPRSGYKQFAVTVDLSDQSARGFGRPSATWRFGVLKFAQRDQLRVFCPGASALVYIRTKKRDDQEVYSNFRAVMVWPEEEEAKAGRILDLEILFRDLVEQP